MKKIVLLTAALFISVVAFSQVSFGLKGGLNYATLTNDEESNFKPSVYGGAFMEYRLGFIASISPELYYSRQGASAKEDGIEAQFRLNYVNLPVLVKLYLADGLSLDLGPQLGYLLDAKLWGKEDGVSATVDAKEFLDMNKIDVGFAAGLTYNIGKFFLQGRYNIGFIDVVKDDVDHSKNNVIQLGVGIRF